MGEGLVSYKNPIYYYPKQQDYYIFFQNNATHAERRVCGKSTIPQYTYNRDIYLFHATRPKMQQLQAWLPALVIRITLFIHCLNFLVYLQETNSYIWAKNGKKHMNSHLGACNLEFRCWVNLGNNTHLFPNSKSTVMNLEGPLFQKFSLNCLIA